MIKKKIKKSQSAIEFIVLVFFVIVFFTIFFLSIEESISDKLKKNKNEFIQEIAVSVQEEIYLASKSSDGYHREFKILDDINGQAYKINLTEGSVYVRTDDSKYSLALPILPVSGDVVKGNNFILKKDGKVYVNILI